LWPQNNWNGEEGGGKTGGCTLPGGKRNGELLSPGPLGGGYEEDELKVTGFLKRKGSGAGKKASRDGPIHKDPNKGGMRPAPGFG